MKNIFKFNFFRKRYTESMRGGVFAKRKRECERRFVRKELERAAERESGREREDVSGCRF